MHSTLPNDLDQWWMPFTDNRYFKANPRVLVAAKDMHYTAGDGRQVLDGCAGLWCVNAGHGRDRIVRAIQQQAAELDFAPTFQFGHPLAFQLANRVGSMMPAGLDRIFFTNSGSESVDTALKIALAYHRARGDGQRTRLIGRERGYHGVGFGGISVGGMVANRRTFGPGLVGVDHLPHTLDQARNAFSKGLPAHGAELADRLEAIIALHGADTIAAVIVEPVAGSTGVLPPPVGYLERLRAITAKHGILLIFDEVINAFGRLGAATAAERFGVTPDLICMAKAITNAAVPMGAVAASRQVHDAIVMAPGDTPGIELFHGYTYSAHALACAAGLATLQLYSDDGLFAQARDLESYFETAVHRMAEAPHVIDIRNFGLMAGIELAPRAGAPGARGVEMLRSLFDAGLLVRASGDTIALSPPLIVSPAEIDEMVDLIANALRHLS
ncbi:aspartate aminotransferase family protein [Sandarakinorhabdus sp.]|uniref:aspartate aminotransferase family protein n=1 Tax=Sandarakinorhabdus sp. TaxID=1916663 RepID=UPI0033420556